MKLQLVIGFASLIVLLLALINVVFYARMNSAIKNQTADMIAHLNTQVSSNVDTFMMGVADNVAKLYEDDELRTKTQLASRDLSTEQKAVLSTKVDSHKISVYYEDFAVICEDGTVYGSVSESTASGQDMKDLYTSLRTALAVNAAGVWSIDVNSNHEYLSYIKWLNDKAIILVSIKSDYIAGNFIDSVFIEGMNVYLVNSSLVIQCSSDENVATGSYLQSQVYRLVDRSGDRTQIGDMYVVSNCKLSNGWFMVTAVPSGEVLKPLKSTIGYVLIISALVFAFALAFTFVMTNNIVKTVDQTVDKLDIKAQTDLLTGLINKRSFEEIVQNTLEHPEPNTSYALVFMDVDNFKGVNDKCGHDIGDEVLRSFAHTIGAVFRDTDIKGRLGGDEFCVLMKMPLNEKAVMVESVNEVCKRFRDALHRKATQARQSLPAVTSSMGAAMWDGVPEEFGHLYHKADIAVYASKKRGKDTWSIYGQGDVDDSIVKDKEN